MWIPSFIFSIIHFFESANNLSKVSIHVNVWLCLTKPLNGVTIGLKEYPHAKWLTSPNQEHALVMSCGLGKSFIVVKILSVGAIPFAVIFNPANSTVLQQNVNLSAFNTMPFVAHNRK